MSTDCTNTTDDSACYDDAGFHRDTGVHRSTGTFYDFEGFDRDGYTADGFDQDGIHRDTDTAFHPATRRTVDGSRYDSEGYNWQGIDSEGYDREGLDSDGYDREGLDSDGNSRCDNGACDDPDCDCHNADSDDLLDADADVLEETGWMAHRYKANAPTVAFEFECISKSTANDGAHYLCSPYDRAYHDLINNTDYGTASIAKHDGSLPDRTGVEFVTVPMLLSEHRTVLAAAFPGGKLGNGHVKAWEQTKCGMHVHLARASLSNLTLGKMLCFMHSSTNVPFHVFIASRQSSYAEFVPHRAAVNNGLPKKAGTGQKYSALNVKDHTVEFRIFRPSVRLETILKNLCYCLAVRDFCRQSSLAPEALKWDRFLMWLGTTEARFTYRELDAWIRKQGGTYGTFYTMHAKPGVKAKPEAA